MLAYQPKFDEPEEHEVFWTKCHDCGEESDECRNREDLPGICETCKGDSLAPMRGYA